MTSMTLDLPRRFPWSTPLSVGIRGVVVAGLLCTPVYQVIELPASVQPISVMMAVPADLGPPQAVQPPPEPVIELEPEPEPIPEPPEEAPMVTEKPKPKPEPKPRPVKKVEGQPKRDVKPAEPRPAPSVGSMAPTCTTTNTAPATTSKPMVSTSSGSCASSRNQPQYPARAQALRIEGRVKVKFNVTPGSRVENVGILSAQPISTFGRKVKDVMCRWRYEIGRPGSGLTMNIIFKLNSTVQIEQASGRLAMIKSDDCRIVVLTYAIRPTQELGAVSRPYQRQRR